MTSAWEPPRLPDAAARPRDQTLARLGAGGMAEVFLIRRTGPGGFEKFLALKRIRAGLDAATFAPMLLDEARLVAALQHPNIVQVHDAGTDEDGLWFLMEYVHGRSLNALLSRAIERGMQVPIECAAYIAACVGRALHYAHHAESATQGRLGVIHRDVSPGNILVGFDGVVKLADFGIARANQRRAETQDGTFKGKYGYAAPEQCRGESLDGASDLFSLGIVLHELLASRHLFSSDAPLATVQAVLHAPIPSLCELRDDVPAELDALVQRMLERSRTARVASGAEAANQLDAIAHQRQLPATRERMAELMALLFTATEMRLKVPPAPPVAEELYTPMRTPISAAGTPAQPTPTMSSSQHSAITAISEGSSSSTGRRLAHASQSEHGSLPGRPGSHGGAAEYGNHGSQPGHSSQPGLSGATHPGRRASSVQAAQSGMTGVEMGSGPQAMMSLPGVELAVPPRRSSAMQRLAAAALVGALSAVGVTMLIGRSSTPAPSAATPAGATTPGETSAPGATTPGETSAPSATTPAGATTEPGPSPTADLADPPAPAAAPAAIPAAGDEAKTQPDQMPGPTIELDEPESGDSRDIGSDAPGATAPRSRTVPPASSSYGSGKRSRPPGKSGQGKSSGKGAAPGKKKPNDELLERDW